MSLRQIARTLTETIDSALLGYWAACSREDGSLLTFLLHRLRRDDDGGPDTGDPQQVISVGRFRQFVEYMLSCGYQFVAPEDVLRPLDRRGRYAMITFDDGYYNNQLAVPVLREFSVPAVFFISTGHVQSGKAFWWDALYRSAVGAGRSPGELLGETLSLKALMARQVEESLTSRFGAGFLHPVGDADRPFTPAELHDFARERHVHLGNHTADHAILTNYPPEGIRQQIAEAQGMLREMAGVEPVSIAYPNGNYDADVLRICAEIGLKVGITTDLRKNRVPADLDGEARLRLGRFVLDGRRDVRSQCRVCRSDVSLYRKLRGRKRTASPPPN